MTIFGLIVLLVLVGAGLYIVQLLPLDATIKKLIYVVVIVAVALWLLSALGLISNVPLRVR
jgi:hypothetical protein